MCSAALHTWVDQEMARDRDLHRGMNMGRGTFLLGRGVSAGKRHLPAGLMLDP